MAAGVEPVAGQAERRIRLALACHADRGPRAGVDCREARTGGATAEADRRAVTDAGMPWHAAKLWKFLRKLATHGSRIIAQGAEFFRREAG
jgi:hypothetical protein